MFLALRPSNALYVQFTFSELVHSKKQSCVVLAPVSFLFRSIPSSGHCDDIIVQLKHMMHFRSYLKFSPFLPFSCF
jgi:hypothetical protein